MAQETGAGGLVDVGLRDRVRREVEDLHRFFVDWLSARVPNEEAVFKAGFLDRLDPGFLIVDPHAERSELGTLSTALKAGYGCNPNFAIQIREVKVARFGDILVATYEEWQRGALASESPNTGRLASAVLVDKGQRLVWILVHETWLPSLLVVNEKFAF